VCAAAAAAAAAAGVRSSGDPQARIYDFNDGAAHSQPRILPIPEEQRAENKDVTAADWHPSGNKLATASYKGLIRVYSKGGEARSRVSRVWMWCVLRVCMLCCAVLYIAVCRVLRERG
jgi:hypothetical protein